MAETINTSQFKNGMCIDLDGVVWKIVEFQHVKPGKGGAFVRTKLKQMEGGKVVEKTFRAGESMPRVHTTVQDMQFLFDDGAERRAHEHGHLRADRPAARRRRRRAAVPQGGRRRPAALARQPPGLAAAARLRSSCVVQSTEPGVKGDTVSNVTKAAVLETGATVQVPLFVNEGERVRVDTRDGRYLGRA